VAKQKNSNKGWIVGTVLGALGGAAYALWKTPMSGRQVRSKLVPGSTGHASATSGGGMAGTLMSKVEHTIAPIVGVKLGQTAHKTGDAEAVRVTETTVYSADSAATGGTTVKSDSDSINEKRWAWGSPAPERNEVDDPKFQAAETARVEPNLPESAPDQGSGPFGNSSSNDAPNQEDEPVVATSSNATPAFGGDTIRQRRFGWGDPAPETVTAPPATEFNNVPSANSVMPEQTPAGASVDAGGTDIGANTTAGPVAVNPERTASGSSLTTPSPQQRVVPTSATDATASVGQVSEGDSVNVDDTVLISAAGHTTGKMNQFPKLGGLED
jgi:gas vesicle protein